VVTWSGCFPESIRHSIDYASLSSGLFVGFAYVPASPDWQQSARRLVDIPITGSAANQITLELTSGLSATRTSSGFDGGISPGQLVFTGDLFGSNPQLWSDNEQPRLTESSSQLPACRPTGIISLPPLEKSLVVGEPTGMMTSDKKGEGFLPGIEFQANHGYSSLFSQRGTH